MKIFQDLEILTLDSLKQLLESKEIPYGLDLIDSAHDFINNLYKDEKRLSGQTMVEHSLAVAGYVAMLNLDTVSIVAALLHGTVESGKVEIDKIDEKFGTEVAFIVDGLTNLKKKSEVFSQHNEDPASFRKLMIAACEDIRVLIIRLADKLHNLKTIDKLDPEKQKYQANKIKLVYAPLAEYLGLGQLQSVFENTSFKILMPEQYLLVENFTKKTRESSKVVFEEIKVELEKIIKEYSIKSHDLSFRHKNFSSTFRKVVNVFMKDKSENVTENDLAKLKDILGIRIIVETVEECYLILGLIHGKWEYYPEEFDDYIVQPKKSGYRSLHTVVNYKGNNIEIQIRTAEMHEINEFGPASHIAYKLRNESKSKNENFTWTKDLVEWQSKSNLSKEDFKVKAFSESVFIFTPKGEVKMLEKGSKPIDFAFKVHGEIGAHYLGAKVNGKMVSMNHELETGDIVEIITTSKVNVTSDWVKAAKMTSTKSAIRKYLRSK